MAFGRFVNSLVNGVPRSERRISAAGDRAGADGAGGVEAQAAADPVSLENAQTARALDELRTTVRANGRMLPTVLTSQLRQIDDLLRIVVTTIEDQQGSTEQRVLLAAMIGDYIPTPLKAFLALPAADRTDESQGTLVFSRQLRLLEETIHDLLNQIRIGAIAELSTHGRFLADKFQAPDADLVLGGR